MLPGKKNVAGEFKVMGLKLETIWVSSISSHELFFVVTIYPCCLFILYRSYNLKELNSASNLNEQEMDHPLELLERNTALPTPGF